ncbi:hypothetical protein PMIN06_005104 [Paraphaeosphaeria minitans]
MTLTVDKKAPGLSLSSLFFGGVNWLANITQPELDTSLAASIRSYCHWVHSVAHNSTVVQGGDFSGLRARFISLEYDRTHSLCTASVHVFQRSRTPWNDEHSKVLLEDIELPRSWSKTLGPVMYESEYDVGGHFAA